jgi:hypothetical protein
MNETTSPYAASDAARAAWLAAHAELDAVIAESRKLTDTMRVMKEEIRKINNMSPAEIAAHRVRNRSLINLWKRCRRRPRRRANYRRYQMSAITKKEPMQLKGINGKGGIPCSNVRVGETVFGALNLNAGTNDTANFESTISVAGQIQQLSASDLRSTEYLIYSY